MHNSLHLIIFKSLHIVGSLKFAKSESHNLFFLQAHLIFRVVVVELYVHFIFYFLPLGKQGVAVYLFALNKLFKSIICNLFRQFIELSATFFDFSIFFMFKSRSQFLPFLALRNLQYKTINQIVLVDVMIQVDQISILKFQFLNSLVKVVKIFKFVVVFRLNGILLGENDCIIKCVARNGDFVHGNLKGHPVVLAQRNQTFLYSRNEVVLVLLRICKQLE